VAHVTWITLDRDYRILEVRGDLAHLTNERVGEILWEAFPDAVDTFLEPYENAWRIGYDNRTVTWRNCIVQTYANVHHDVLTVCYHVIALEGLKQTLRQFEADLAAAARSGRASVSSPTLQIEAPPSRSRRNRGLWLLHGGAILLRL
jgi:hypothetical protein